MADLLISADPKSLPPSYYKAIVKQYLLERQTQDVIDILIQSCGPNEHVSLYVRFPDLIDHDPPFAYFVSSYPHLMIPIFNESLIDLQSQILNHPDFQRLHGRGSLKKNCHVRLTHLPPIFSLSKPTINDINSISDDLAQASLVQFCGTITRTSGIRMLEVSKQYQCQNPKCKYRFTVYADPEQGNMLPQPRTCPSRAQDGSKTSCSSTIIREVEGSRQCVDYQEIRVQDKIEHLQFGAIPRTIIVTIEADLVDRHRPGDDVIIVGTIIRQWKPVLRSARITIDIAIRAHSLRDMNILSNLNKKVLSESSKPKFDVFWSQYTTCPFQGRNHIIKSICPQLYGMYYVKLCLLLTLIGGSIHHEQYPTTSTQPSSSSLPQEKAAVRRRYQSHLLLIGDPGCGKSQLLRFAASISRRSVLTTGIGTTGAGLTCSMVKDGADWEIEAGALVLANDGICCIDEFASVREQDRATIHEAMEQQTLSIAKAGVVVKLNTRATVIACCNPKGSYDPTLDISTNTAIASPLLSRFDLVLILLDTPNKEWDRKVSTFLLQRSIEGHVADKHHQNTSHQHNQYQRQQPWDMGILGQYITHVRSTYHPYMDRYAKALLRQSDDRSSSRTTVRLLESLARLSEAHAKLMQRTMVQLCDAVVAIRCISLSQTKSSILENNATLQSDFPDDGDNFYDEEEKKVFELLVITKERFIESVDEDETIYMDKVDEMKVLNIMPTASPMEPVDIRNYHISADHQGREYDDHGHLDQHYRLNQGIVVISDNDDSMMTKKRSWMSIHNDDDYDQVEVRQSSDKNDNQYGLSTSASLTLSKKVVLSEVHIPSNLQCNQRINTSSSSQVHHSSMMNSTHMKPYAMMMSKPSSALIGADNISIPRIHDLIDDSDDW